MMQCFFVVESNQIKVNLPRGLSTSVLLHKLELVTVIWMNLYVHIVSVCSIICDGDQPVARLWLSGRQDRPEAVRVFPVRGSSIIPGYRYASMTFSLKYSAWM